MLKFQAILLAKTVKKIHSRMGVHRAMLEIRKGTTFLKVIIKYFFSSYSAFTKANFGSMTRRQPDFPDVNHCALSYLTQGSPGAYQGGWFPELGFELRTFRSRVDALLQCTTFP